MTSSESVRVVDHTYEVGYYRDNKGNVGVQLKTNAVHTPFTNDEAIENMVNALREAWAKASELPQVKGETFYSPI